MFFLLELYLFILLCFFSSFLSLSYSFYLLSLAITSYNKVTVESCFKGDLIYLATFGK